MFNKSSMFLIKALIKKCCKRTTLLNLENYNQLLKDFIYLAMYLCMYVCMYVCNLFGWNLET